MPFKREPSPLQNTTKEIDGLKKKVGKLCDEANKVFKAKKEPKDKEARAEKLRNEYEELQSELESVGEKLSNLKEEDEPSKVKNYENKKSSEEKRLTSFQEQLDKYKEYLEEAKEEEEEVEEGDDEESGTDDEEEEGDESEEEEGEEEGEEEEEEEDYTGLSKKEIQKKKEAKEKKEKEAKKNQEKEEKKKEKEKMKEDKKKEKEKEQKDKKKKDEEVQDEKSSKGKSKKDGEKKGKGDTKSDSEKDKLEECEETDEEDDGEDDSEEEEEEESVSVEQRRRKQDKQEKEEEESDDDDDDADDDGDDDDDGDEEEENKEMKREVNGKKPEIKRPQIRSRLTSRKEEVEKKEERDETDEEETDEEEESKVEGTKGKKEEDGDEDDDEDDENDDDDDDDDDETDDDDESEESEDDTQEQGTMRQYEAIGDWSGVKKGDLSVKKGDVVTVIDARIDGWLQAENKDGQRGLVPINYFRVSNAYKSVQQDDGKAEEEEEEEFDEEENSDFDETETKTPRSGKVLWKNIKKAVKETSVTDVLHAMGAVPAGFRESTLGKKKTQEEYTSINYLAPKLSASCVSYKDLFFDPDANKIRPRNVRIQRIVTLMACRQIPLPGMETEEHVEVTSRHVRIALYDGKKILSNIHTVRVQSVDKEQRTWNFQTRVTDNMKSLEFGDIFIRTNSTEGNIGILFELCITYVRTSTNEEGEFSCGWVHFPLYDQNGVPTPNKTHDLFVNGGRPDEKGVDVDPTVGRRGSTNPFRSLMSGNKQPRLVIKINAPSREQKDLLDTLPDVLVGNTLYIQYISFYRQILMDALLRDNMEPQSTELIHSPLLTHFPGVVEQPDFMDVLRTAWAERLKSAKRAEKQNKEMSRDQESMKELFQRVFLEHLYPLCHSASLPLVKFGDRENEKVRFEEIQRLLKIGKDKKLAFAALLSPDAVMEPFSIDEVAFNVIGPYCTNRHV